MQAPKSVMRKVFWLAALLAAGLAPPTARAVIRVDIPLSKVYATAGSVLIGVIERTSVGNRVADVRVTETIKGDSPGQRVRVQVAAPAELFKSVAVGQPIVLFVGDQQGVSAAIHLADTWLLAEALPKADPPAWRVGQVHGIKETFPGRTAALAEVLRQMKVGKGGLLEEIEHDVFRGGVRQLCKLDTAGATFLRVADVNGDRKPDLLVGVGKGVKLFLAGDKGYTDVTAAWGLASAAGPPAAFGDVNGDGRCDLLLGGRILVNDGARFVPEGAPLELPADAKPLAAALADLTGDGRADAAVLLADGRLVTATNPGSPGKPWTPRPVRQLWGGTTAGASPPSGETPLAAEFGFYGDNGRLHAMVVTRAGATRYPLDDDGAPADHPGLTGKPVGTWHRGHRDGLSEVLAAGIDINADGRRDLLIVAKGGGLLLVNRGAGSFLVNPDAAEPILDPERPGTPPALTPATPIAAADLAGDGREDLLILADDGRLFVAENVPPKDGDRKP